MTPKLPGFLSIISMLVVLLTANAQSTGRTTSATLPDSPRPQTPASSTVPSYPCKSANSPENSLTEPGNPTGVGRSASGSPPVSLAPCATLHKNWYARFVAGPRDNPLTPKDKGWLAARDVVDPFNVITILGEAGIAIGSDPDSPYGPGMPGYERDVGVSFTEDMTGEFIGTFLIPSITHQDPRYHRMQHASILRRTGHACLQVLWTQGDNGKGMPNYANIIGFAGEEEIGNLYIPGRKTNMRASSERYATDLATAPIGNIVSEFLPDVASHIHVQVVIIQRIINRVARTNDGNL